MNMTENLSLKTPHMPFKVLISFTKRLTNWHSLASNDLFYDLLSSLEGIVRHVPSYANSQRTWITISIPVRSGKEESSLTIPYLIQKSKLLSQGLSKLSILLVTTYIYYVAKCPFSIVKTTFNSIKISFWESKTCS